MSINITEATKIISVELGRETTLGSDDLLLLCELYDCVPQLTSHESMGYRCRLYQENHRYYDDYHVLSDYRGSYREAVLDALLQLIALRKSGPYKNGKEIERGES